MPDPLVAIMGARQGRHGGAGELGGSLASTPPRSSTSSLPSLDTAVRGRALQTATTSATTRPPPDPPRPAAFGHGRPSAEGRLPAATTGLERPLPPFNFFAFSDFSWASAAVLLGRQ